MPRYYFHVEDGRSYPDEEGVELADIDAARINATRMFGAMLCDDPTTFWNGDEWTLKVTDEEGLVLFCVHFVAIDSPVGQRHPYRPPARTGLPG